MSFIVMKAAIDGIKSNPRLKTADIEGIEVANLHFSFDSGNINGPMTLQMVLKDTENLPALLEKLKSGEGISTEIDTLTDGQGGKHQTIESISTAGLVIKRVEVSGSENSILDTIDVQATIAEGSLSTFEMDNPGKITLHSVFSWGKKA